MLEKWRARWARQAGDVDARLRRSIEAVCPLDVDPIEIHAESELQRDLGLSSLTLVALAATLEDEMGVDLLSYADRLSSVRTVGDIEALVAEARSAAEVGTAAAAAEPGA